ncbi:uncharacterized protein LOC133174219 isoform X2 [Saccostrea echinata]|uniref:uncharacterized protein LOC133174219 isoform X2 n=1 Tax=Saccostrea echinata TaxID=191078 RepID=UPI002A816A29|nr:uncharacterized protein LOC133174219 isoform X2 [Saccostrea echinata]
MPLFFHFLRLRRQGQRNMFRILFLMFGMYCTTGMLPFPRNKGNNRDNVFSVQITDLSDGGVRSANGSRHLSLSLSDGFIDFDLTWNQNTETNAPIYTTDSEGIVRIQHVPQSKEIRFYQDVENGASFMIMSNNSSSCMTGIFLYRKSEYIMEPETDDCLRVSDRDTKYRIIEVDRSHAPFADVLKPRMDQGGLFHGTKMNRANRKKRQINHYKIEMFFIIDYSIYLYWYEQSKASSLTAKDEEAKGNIREFYSFVINGMDVRYKNIQTSSYTISILFSGIYIADAASKSTFTENNKIVSVSGTQIDSEVALTAVTSWLQGTPGLPQHDHAMMFTRYDFTKGGSSDNAGLAWLGALCTTQSVSVVEDHFDFNVITIAAHELGHGLSAAHDGINNSCNGNDAYIMAATSVPMDNQNPWKFSICSTNYFTSFINKLNRENNNCMTVLSPEFNPDALKQYTALPGEIYDADAHCRHILGSESSFCKDVYNQNFTSICTKLWCKKTDGSGLCISAVGGDGIQCGNKKWCIAGVCKNDECAPPGDESCLYGDTKAKVFEFSGNDITCSFEDIKKYPFVCYSVNTRCCRQCQNFFTGITGCEYGDKTTGCSLFHCPSNPDICCGTCYNGPAITTPSQEPTTQKYQNPCRSTVTSASPEQTTAKSSTPVSSKTTKPPITTPAPSATSTTTTIQTTATSTTTTVQHKTTIQQETTTPKPTSVSTLLFMFTITLSIDIPEDLSDHAQKIAVMSKLQTMLVLLYKNELNSRFISCVVQTLHKGSLKVSYDIKTTSESKSTSNVASLSRNMASGNYKVMYEGKEVTVSSIAITDSTGTSRMISKVTPDCEILQVVNPCPSDYECVNSNRGPVCRENLPESNLSKYRDYIIYVGIGAFLLVSLFITCICCLHKKRNRARKKRYADNNQHRTRNTYKDGKF